MEDKGDTADRVGTAEKGADRADMVETVNMEGKAETVGMGKDMADKEVGKADKEAGKADMEVGKADMEAGKVDMAYKEADMAGKGA